MRKLGEKLTRLVKQDVVFKVRRTSCSYFIRSHFGLITRFVDLVGLFWFHGFLTGWWFLMEHQLSIVRIIPRLAFRKENPQIADRGFSCRNQDFGLKTPQKQLSG